MKVQIKSESLQKELARKNKSQNWFAHHIGISSGYMSQIMSGERCPSPELREKILDYFQTKTFDDFFTLEPQG